MRHALRQEQDVVSNSPAPIESPSQTTPAQPPVNTDYGRWDMTRLIVALVVCALIVGAAVAYDQFG